MGMGELEMPAEAAPSGSRVARLFRVVLCQLAIIGVTLIAIEGILRVLDLRYLRILGWESRHYQYEPELGWSPTPNISVVDAGPRQIRISHNRIGLRDIEHRPGSKPTILVVGDSFVYGVLVQAEERFTDLLRDQLPDHAVVNAGVSGYGTDQEYLMLRRMWDYAKPQLVVVMFCTLNDRRDNTNNIRYDTFKPYFEVLPDGTARFAGTPVPKSKSIHYQESWLAERVLLVRLAIAVYVELTSPRASVPDPTERLVGLMRDFVESNGAKFIVGLQGHDEQLEAYLREQRIPFVAIDDAPDFMSQPKYELKDLHWSPEGHAVVASRLRALIADIDPGTSPQRSAGAGN
jgi:GDSL-like Lipase/Acylhydrolase family